MEIRTLTEADRPLLHPLFLEAFGDYAVALRPDAGRFARMLVRRGVALERSVGAFDGGRLVAAMAVAVGDWLGAPTAYDVFTGVVPSHRGRGLAGALLDHAAPRLAADGYRRFLLEVLRDNAPAIRAYERAGFVAGRRLECFELPAAELPRAGGPFEVVELERPDPEAARAFADWRPSWQNSDDAVRRGAEGRVVLAARDSADGGRTVGHAVLYPAEADLAQLAVAPAHRRRGAATALLAAARKHLAPDAALRAGNVPADAAPDLALWRALGARVFASQQEMERAL